VGDAPAPISDTALRVAFREWLLRAADDELVIGHRHSEWTGFGPDIESDVAMSSIAQEEIGHARAFYDQAAADSGKDADRLAFDRAPTEYRHGILLERENDGWEFSIVRLALYEPFEVARLRVLGACGQEPVAGLARTVAREERYHGLFAETWLTRLARATPEGHAKVQAALERAWPDALGLFEATAADDLLQTRGVITRSPASLRTEWEEAVRPLLEELSLAVPAAASREGGRHGRHTAEFDAMLAQMTEVWRSDPEAKW
jgi:ring-1,2-phenylacetyl-CoA epoxidase subunit PaaC